MKYVLVYESADADPAELQRVFPEHQARWKQYRDAGTLLLIGPFSDRSGALGVFSTRAAAEDFAAGDPFVLQGLITRWYIREWMEVLYEPATHAPDAS